MKHIFISDIHARYQILKKVIKEYPNHFKIFAGDICDNLYFDRDKHSNVKSLNIVIDIFKSKNGICLQSNHNWKLLRYLEGYKNRLKEIFPDTVREIEAESFDWQLKLLNWISKLPYYFRFEEDNKKFICAHAYYNQGLINSARHNPHWLDTKKEMDWYRQLVIYGPRDHTKPFGRDEWWIDGSKYNDIGFPSNTKLLVGHYHININTDKFTIVDTNNEALAVYIPQEDTIRIFE